MKPEQRALLRAVMKTAWEFYRSAGAHGEPFAGFSEALKSAWRPRQEMGPVTLGPPI
jgi:hypothetical protein